MTETSDSIDADALDWAVRTADPEFADWEAFAAWLAADERHARRYDAVAAAVDEAAEALATLPAPRPVLPVRPGAPRRRWLAGAGIAAGLAAVVGWSALPTTAEPWVIETQPGAAKRIAMADGSSITLAGGSRVTLDRADARRVSLDRGEALFTVRHDAARPFRVTAGTYELLDVGTVFDVKHLPTLLRVAVSEGEVIVNPGRERLRLPMGKVVAIDMTSKRAEVSSIDPATVGGWRGGQLSYDGARLDEVAADLSRLTGRTVTAAGVGERTFRGTIDVGAVGSDPALLGSVLGVTVRETGRGWELARSP